MTTPSSATVVPWRTVHALTGLSRVTVWRLRRQGQFPCPIRLSANRIGWRLQEIVDWLGARASERAQ